MNTKIIIWFMIGSAVVWGAVIVGCSIRLSGSDCYDKISYLLYGGVIVHIVMFQSLISLCAKANQDKFSESSDSDEE